VADQVRCPDCGDVLDARGANSHARTQHGKPKATKEDFELMNDNKPVTEADTEAEVEQAIEDNGGQLVGMTDNAIVFRNEVIVTDPEIKERVADKLVESVSGGTAQF